jgi:hypothetical protein
MPNHTQQSPQKPTANRPETVEPIWTDVSDGMFNRVAGMLPPGTVKRVSEVVIHGRVIAEIELSTGQLCQDETFFGAVILAKGYISRWEVRDSFRGPRTSSDPSVGRSDRAMRRYSQGRKHHA